MKIDFTKNNSLIPAIIQDEKSGEIYMLGYMNEEAFEKTKETNFVWFWSRSRKKLWMKGETSGNKLKVNNIFVDCDQDTLLIKVKLIGTNVCHTGNRSCFFDAGGTEGKPETGPAITMTLEELYQIIESRKQSTDENSYVAALFKKGKDRIVQKIGEEATEVIIAAKNRRKKDIIEEIADLWFHTLIMLSAMDIKPEEIFDEFERRKK